MIRSLSVVEITQKAGLRRKWLGEVPFCLLTDLSECDSKPRDFSSTSKAMVRPVPYFIYTGSQTWIKSGKHFSEISFITTGVTHDVSCWARFQPSTAQSEAYNEGGTQFRGRRITMGRRINAGAPKNLNNVTSRPTFFNTAHLLPKDLRFEYGGAKLAPCPGTI